MHQMPFFLNTGQHPWKGTDTRQEYRNEAAGQFAEQMKHIREDAAAALRQSSEHTKHNHDRHACPAHEYAQGDLVYLEATHLKTHRPSKRLDDKHFGPFRVVKKVGRSAYKLQLPPTWAAVHPVFNESYLTPYHTPSFPSQHEPPPPLPVDVQGEPEYDVEEVLDS